MQQGQTPSFAAEAESHRMVVMKFGGTSVGDLARIRSVATRVLQAQALGMRPVLVVSAMAGETDRLLGLARALGTARGTLDAAELDVLAATGEQVAAALTAMAIQAQGGRARSFLAHQLPICTVGSHGEARVRSLDPQPLVTALQRGEIPVIAGFQGISAAGRVTTLGRGGSDTTAVAVAAALDAIVCEIYTDVDGVHAADPKVVLSPPRLASIPYRSMLALAERGAKVLHPRSVALAERHGVRVRVRSSFANSDGTLVASPKDIHDVQEVAAVACDYNVAQVTLTPHGGGEALVFVVRGTDLAKLSAVFPAVSWTLTACTDLAAVTLVGGIAAEPAQAGHILDSLLDQGIQVRGLSFADQTITCLVTAAAATAAVRRLHQTYVTIPENRVQRGANHGKVDQDQTLA